MPQKTPLATYLIESNEKGRVFPETSQHWNELKMTVSGEVDFSIGAIMRIESHSPAAPAEIIFAYNEHQYTVPWSEAGFLILFMILCQQVNRIFYIAA